MMALIGQKSRKNFKTVILGRASQLRPIYPKKGDDDEKHPPYQRSVFSEEVHSFILPSATVLRIFSQIGQLIYQRKLGRAEDQLELSSRLVDLSIKGSLVEPRIN
ncbi:hypothetical protein YC2023_119293 [Brassica napus]